MANPLRVLVVEDMEDDALLMLRALEAGGYAPLHERVSTLPAFTAALGRGPWDVVLSDYRLGGFTGLDVLERLKQSGKVIPFILISATIGEERAVETVKLGAADYVLKGNLGRLVPVIEREVRAGNERAARLAAEADRDRLVGELRRERESLQEKVNARTQELSESFAKLQASSDLVTLTTRNMPGIVFRREVKSDGSLSYSYFAGRLLETFQLRPEDVMRNPAMLLGLIHPADREPQIQALNPAQEDLQPRTFTFRAVAPGGGVRWIEVQTHAAQRPDGTVYRDGLMTDVTGVKEAEAQLAASEQRLRTLINNVPGVVFRQRMTPDGHVSLTFASERLHTVLGITPDEAVSEPGRIESLFHPDDREALSRSLQESAAKLSLRDIEFRMLHPDGTEHWVHLRAVPHREPNGDIEWDGIAHDVTDRRRLEDSLRHAERLQAMAQLTDGVAHHFNNLLFIISGHAELLERECAAVPRAGESLTQIGEAVSRGARLVQELRQTARPAPSGGSPVPVNELLAGVHRLAAQVMGGGIELTLDSGSHLPPVKADSSRLQTALLNLLFNARDALPEGGRVVLTSRALLLDGDAARPLNVAPGSYVEISVKDNGAGMKPNVLERAFNPFFTTKPVGRGIGLGLSMVHSFARQSGGTTTLHSAPGVGTEVRLLLPASPSARA